MILDVIFIVLLSLFALYGFYSAARLLITSFTVEYCNIAVWLEPGDDEEILRLKLSEARFGGLFVKHRTVVLLPEDRAADSSITDVLDSMNIKYYVINGDADAGR